MSALPQGRDDWSKSVAASLPQQHDAQDSNEDGSHFYLPLEIRDWIVNPPSYPLELAASRRARLSTNTDSTEPRLPLQNSRVAVPPSASAAIPMTPTQLDPLIAHLLATTNEAGQIHPLFHLHPRFPSLNLSTDTSSRIGPALLLASKVLCSSRAMHFFNALLFGPRSRSSSKRNERILSTYQYTHFDRQLPLGSAWAILDALNRLAPEIEFFFVPLDDNQKADCRVEFGWHFDSTTMQWRFARIGRVEIFINDKFVRETSPLMAQDLAKIPKKHILRCWLKLASALLGQAARALGTVYLGTTVELCFGDEYEPDYAKAFETWVFGMRDPEVFLSDEEIERLFMV